MLYTLTWEIDIDADSPEDAVMKAMAIHRDPDSIATIFEVKCDGEPSQSIDALDVSS